MSESTEHKEVVAWFRSQYPEYARSLRVSQSGRRSGSSKRAAMAWAAQVAHGAVTGEADISILLKRGEYGSLVMEFKAGDGMYQPTQLQRDYISYHEEVGNCAVICRGVDIAKAAIKQYMELPDEAG